MSELEPHHKCKTEDAFQTLEHSQRIAFLYSKAFSVGHNLRFKKAQHFGKDLLLADPAPTIITIASLDLVSDFYQSLGSLPRIFCTRGLACISARLKSNSFE